MLRLDLRQNALHTLHHAVEHLEWSEAEEPNRDGRSFDEDGPSIVWRTEAGHLCFVSPDFTRLPAVYSLKFALLHLIQGVELVLKCYIDQCEPTALFVRQGSRQTISLRAALNFAIERNPTLLSPAEVALILEAKEFRNAIEHYRFDFEESRLRALCADFLAICVFLSQTLLSVSLAGAFSWDSLRDEPDKVADYLARVLSQSSDMGRRSAKRAGELWASQNASCEVFLCLNCGARSVSADRNICMACGMEGDEDTSAMLEEFEWICRNVAEARKRGLGLGVKIETAE